MKSAEQKAKKVPTIRFAGFEDEWVEKKLGDVAGVYDGVHQTPDYRNSGVMFLSVENISSLKSEKYISQDAFEKNYKVYPQKGDVLMTRIGDVGTPNVVESDEKIAYYVSLALLKPFDVDSYFLNDVIQSKTFQKRLKERTLLTAIPMKINKDEIGKVGIIHPIRKNEQRKIGSFFSNIDSLISLEQKKYDKLTQVKKSMLEKMFPKEGATVPEIRFAGFTGEWEKKKLSDEFVDFIVPMRDKPKSFDGKIPWTRIEDIEGKFLNGSLSGQYVSEKTIAQMNLKVIPKNSLIVSSSATFGVVAVVTQDLVTNQTFIGLVPNDKESLDFWYIFFYSDKAREYMKSQSAGSTIFYIARESFENMPVMIPSREEQQKIGSYFSHLDSLISLQQRKLEKLKNIKKSLLEKMFV